MKDVKYGTVTLEKKPDAPEDEPCFVLRGQDLLAPAAVRAYADSVEATVGGEVGRRRAALIRERADMLAGWRNRKLPD